MSTVRFNPYTCSATQVIDNLKSGITGLSDYEWVHRLKIYGYNEIPAPDKISGIMIFLRQFKSSIVLLLFLAAVISILFQDYTESIAILGVILVNAGIGFALELQAVSSMEALRKLDKVYALVLRNNEVREIEARELVPGDIMILEQGNIVLADARLIEISQLEVNESALTGESIPVAKQADIILDPNVVLADRINMVFKGTSVSRGNAKAIVTTTGLNTEMGAISDMVKKAQKDEIPLNRKLNAFSRKLIWLTLFIVVVFFIIGMLRGNQAHLMLETAIALAVAAIPEGLPIVATISLANGMLRLAKSNVIVKKLAAVETLGGTEIIMTDKTGTLTENQLKVETVRLVDDNVLPDLSLVAVLCNNASLNEEGIALGDPVETALLKYVAEWDANFIKKTRAEWSEVGERPFDSTTRYMANLYKKGSQYIAVAKGSPAEILDICQYVEGRNGRLPLRKDVLDYWRDQTHRLATEGLKVLAFAYKRLDEPIEEYARGLVFLGLAGFLDPPRPEVKQSILECHNAGIKVIMVTGDHPETAKTIARQIGLVEDEQEIKVIHGKDLIVDDSNLSERIEETRIFSRVTPGQKLELTQYFQQKGLVVAMTGDGVNDAPALKKADIGIAMGIRGTQVAEEAADMILQDDSFSSIVKAVKQGRIIFRNIKNFIVYLLSCNLSEIMVVSIAAFSNVSLPLLPLQILFLNLVTDVFPALALGMGKGNPHIMKHRSRNPEEAIISTTNWISIIVYSIVLTLSILTLFYFSIFYLKYDAVASNNIAFFTLALAQLWHPFNLIGRKDSLIRNEIVKNSHLWLAIMLCMVLVLAAYFIPFLRSILYIEDIRNRDWLYILGASLAPLFIIRMLKKFNFVS